MDQVNLPEKDPIIVDGCDTRNDFKGWNVSTEQCLRDRKRDLMIQ